jgi:hypothetical protein
MMNWLRMSLQLPRGCYASPWPAPRRRNDAFSFVRRKSKVGQAELGERFVFAADVSTASKTISFSGIRAAVS